MAGTAAQSVMARQRFCIRLAQAADDDALRRLLRQTPMDGSLRVTMQREPSYFQAAVVDGPHCQTLVVVDNRNGEIVGMGCRSIRLRFVDGKATPVGYLSGLRIIPQLRGRTLLARGYREILRLHGDGAAKFYVTTIADRNRRAFEALTQQRAGLPSYSHLGKYHTFVLPLRRLERLGRRHKFDIRPLNENDIPALIDLAHKVGQSKLFVPSYSANDFKGPSATFKGLAPHNIFMAWNGSQPLACVALWDQTDFKQTVVEGYAGALRYFRAAFNATASILAWPRFPAAGQPFQTLIAALPLIAKGHEQAFVPLLAAAANHARSSHPIHRSLTIGLFERDPLFETIQRLRLFRYVTHVFLVCWDGEGVEPTRFQGRDLYLELGCL